MQKNFFKAMMVPNEVVVLTDEEKVERKVLTPEALQFVSDLVKQFGPRLERLVKSRSSAADLPYTGLALQADWATWRVAQAPPDLTDRRVEITGPPDRKMVINALNSGANVFMADFEDSCSPTWDNLVTGQSNLMDAVRRTITFTSPDGSKHYKLDDDVAVLMVRPRGLHLHERHFKVDDVPIPAALFDFGMYFFHNVHELINRGTGAYFYLPKLEGFLEARLWNDIFVWSQDRLDVPRGTIRATVLIETLPAAFQMELILYELREHSAGLNCGRWDYIFSFIKKQAGDSKAVLPDRSQLTMDKGFLAAYSRLLIQTCHRRGAHAMGGMAAQVPIKDDVERNQLAMDKVKADKEREASWGHDGTWVAHPGLVTIAFAAFNIAGRIMHSIDNTTVTHEDLLKVPEGTRTEEGLRHNIRVGVQYIEAWLRGQGCVQLYDLMEDAATAEISRAQVWQWLHHNVEVGDLVLTKSRFTRTMTDETRSFVGGRYDDARELFTRLVTSPTFEDFLTIPAYNLLKD